MGCSDIGHDFYVISCTFFGAEATGYLGFYFYHANVTFCLIVIKGNHEVFDKKADGCLVIRKTLHKCKDFTFFLPATLFLCGFRKGIFAPCFSFVQILV